MTTQEKPLITFALFAYNQEKFVGEAVAGALAQTWTPLEIVLSDDCSDDATFEIMRNMARKYEGPHSIVLNRNEQRLGTGAHISKVIQLCKGEWIVAAAGDDVSLPERTVALYSHWTAQGKTAGLVYSNIIETKEDGTLLYKRDFRKEVPGGWAQEQLSWDYNARLAQQNPPVHGASFGYPRRTFDDFGPIWHDIFHEDNVLNWRAELRGGVSLCTDYLVYRRNHSGQVTNIYSRQALRGADERRRMMKWSSVQSSRQNLADAKLARDKGWIEIGVYEAAENMLSEQINREELEYRLHWGSFMERWLILLGNWRALSRRKRISELLFATMPRPLYMAALRCKAGISRSGD
jgi:glycosyltransferase involved in cell wall biosynthesis